MTERYKEAFGVEFIEVVIRRGNHPEALSVLQALAARGLTRLLVEGGSALAVLLRAGSSTVSPVSSARRDRRRRHTGFSTAWINFRICAGSFSKLRAGRQRHAGNLRRRGLGSSRALFGEPMFTGLITAVGRVRAVTSAGDRRIEIETSFRSRKSSCA